MKLGGYVKSKRVNGKSGSIGVTASKHCTGERMIDVPIRTLHQFFKEDRHPDKVMYIGGRSILVKGKSNDVIVPNDIKNIEAPEITVSVDGVLEWINGRKVCGWLMSQDVKFIPIMMSIQSCRNAIKHGYFI